MRVDVSRNPDQAIKSTSTIQAMPPPVPLEELSKRVRQNGWHAEDNVLFAHAFGDMFAGQNVPVIHEFFNMSAGPPPEPMPMPIKATHGLLQITLMSAFMVFEHIIDDVPARAGQGEPWRKMPDQLKPPFVLALFRYHQVYSSLRRIITNIASPKLRTAWASFVPGVVDDKGFQLEPSLAYDEYFGPIVRPAVRTLSTMQRNCKPARDRMAEDAGLLEAWLINTLSDPALLALALLEKERTTDEILEIAEHVVAIGQDLPPLVSSNPETWLQLFETKRETPAFKALHEISGKACEVFKATIDGLDDSVTDPEDGSTPAWYPVTFMLDFFDRCFTSAEKAKEVIKKFNNVLETDGDRGVDSCDICGKDNVSLNRCSKCRVVRYCGAECQAKAWKRHKKDCFDAMSIEMPAGK